MIIIHLMKNNQDIRCCGGLRDIIPFASLCFYFVNDGMPVFGWVLF